MPQHFTAPPPYAREGGRIPDCRSLPNAISEAEDYLRRARGWLQRAEAAEKRANTLAEELQEVVNSARTALDAAAALLNKTPAGSPSFDAKEADWNEAHAVYKRADADLHRAQDEAYARYRARREAQDEVDKSESYLRKLQAALANCPTPDPKPVTPPHEGGSVVPPLPPIDMDCIELEFEITKAKAEQQRLERLVQDLSLDINHFQEKWDGQMKDLRNAERKLEAAQQAFNAVPQSHDGYWDHLNSDGSPAIQYRPNAAFAKAQKARDDAKKAVDAARETARETRAKLDQLVNDRIKANDQLQEIVDLIPQLEAALEICRRKAMAAVEAEHGRATKILVGLSAFAVAFLTVAFVVFGGHGHRADADADPAIAVSTSVDRPSSDHVTPSPSSVSQPTEAVPAAPTDTPKPTDTVTLPPSEPERVPSSGTTEAHTTPSPSQPVSEQPSSREISQPPGVVVPPATEPSTTEPPSTPPTEEPPSAGEQVDTTVGPPIISGGGIVETPRSEPGQPTTVDGEVPPTEVLG